MADIIDLALVSTARRILRKFLTQRGLTYFMARDGKRLMALDPAKIDIVVRSAVRARAREDHRPPEEAVNDCRQRVRRVLIREVARAMMGLGY